MEKRTAIILAGGKSSRIGRNKALLKIENEVLIEQTVKKMKLIAEETILVTNQPELYSNLQIKCVTDEVKGKGPLGGLYSGLKSSTTWHNFIVACDMPFIEPDIIKYMFEEARDFDVVVPCIRNNLEPLHAIYSKNCIEPIEKCLFASQYRLVSFYPDVKVKYLTEHKLASYNLSKVFFNINTEEDFIRISDFNKNGEKS